MLLGREGVRNFPYSLLISLLSYLRNTDPELWQAYAILPTLQSHTCRANMRYWRGQPKPSMHPPSLFRPAFYEECLDGFANLLSRLPDF